MTAGRQLLILSLFAALAIVGSSASYAQGSHFHTVLLGGNELALPSSTGFGTVAMHFRGGPQVCVGIIVNGIGKPTAAHIHEAFAPQNGPPIVTLPTPASGNPGFSGGCVAITAALMNQIRANPARFYVNVHNAQFPNGALRGQLR